MAKAKPGITLFLDGWVSEGWYTIKDQGKPEAESLRRKAQKCIYAGKDIQDVRRRLMKAGFTVHYVSKHFDERFTR
jgi:hypothetical protein